MWLMKYLSKKLIKIGKSISNFLAYYKGLTTLSILGFTEIVLISYYVLKLLVIQYLVYFLKNLSSNFYDDFFLLSIYFYSLQFVFLYCSVFITTGLADILTLITYVYILLLQTRMCSFYLFLYS